MAKIKTDLEKARQALEILISINCLERNNCMHSAISYLKGSIHDMEEMTKIKI